MKHIILITLFVSTLSTFAQTGIVTLKSGETKEIKITASSATTIHFQSGYFLIADIATIEFPVLKASDQSLVDKLVHGGVKVTVAGEEKQAVSPPPVVAPVSAAAATIPASPVMIKQETVNIDQLVLSLDKFRDRRAFGKGLQLVGVVAIGASLFFALDNDPTDPKVDNDLLKGLALGGAAVAGIGFALDIDAGRHLRIRR